MDRVNRPPLFASTFLALPAALLMVTLSTAQSPEVRLAVGQGNESPQAIRQVAGRQSDKNQTRPGLLQVLAGTRSKGSENHQHQNMSRTPSKGLLDTLFSRSSGGQASSPSHNAHTGPQAHSGQHVHSGEHVHSGHAQRQPVAGQPNAARNPHSGIASHQQPDWSGVPFHEAEAARQPAQPVPLRDPGDPSLVAQQPSTRIIRGGTSRTIPAQTASSRRPSGANDLSPPQPPMPIPTPPKDVSITTTAPENLSTNRSSRRSGRRSVSALDVTRSTHSTGARATVRDDDEVVDLVPKVSRKTIQSNTAKQPAESGSSVSAKSKAATPSNEATKTVTDKTGTEQKATSSTVPSTNERPASLEGAKAPALSPAPSGSVPTRSVPKQQAKAPASQAPGSQSVSSSNNRVTASSNSTAVNSASAPASVANEPSRPYAASMPPAEKKVEAAPATTRSSSARLGTPALTASHRSGPPAAAFASDEIAQAPAANKPNGVSLNAASTPVGSGVVPNGGVASYRRPSAPTYQVAENGSTGSNLERPTDPYGEVNRPAARSLSTQGESMQPMNAPPAHGFAAQPPKGLVGDNFTRTTPDGRNQMREAMTGSAAASSTSELPGIRVTTVGPGAIMIRQTNQYEIRVENRGSIDASGVMVRALVPDWADLRGRTATRGDIDNQMQGSRERLVWTIDQLPAGASETMTVRLTAARSGTYDLEVDWTLLPQQSRAKVQVREPRLDLTIEGPDEVVYGQSQTYKVRVLNPGDGTAPNVVFTLSPNSATPQSQRIGDIPPGKEAQFDVELTAQDLGDLKIHGLAAGDLQLRAESEKTIRVAAAKLEAVLSGPELKYQNTEAMYSLQIQNNGSATSNRVVASLRLPSGAKYLGGIEGADRDGSVLRWNIDSLAPGANRSYQFRCNMASTGEHVLAFDCQGTAAGNAAVSISTRVESIADLVLTVSDPVAPAPIGSDVTYEIVIRNRGSKEATDVRAIAQFSHGIEPKRIEGQSGEVMTGQVLFDPIPRIAAGQEIRLRVIAQAESAGHHRFRTEVRSGDTVLVAEEATHYMSPKGERVSRRSSEVNNR